METLGDRIRMRRKELGWTQGQVAKAVGMGTGTISDLENGRQIETTKPHLIAEKLGVRVEWLTTGRGLKYAPGGTAEEPGEYVVTRSVHQTIVSQAGAELGAEWDKIEGDEYRQLARDFIYGLVAAQKRAARLPAVQLSTRAKEPKTKDRRVRPD